MATDFIDNRFGNTLLSALRGLLRGVSEGSDSSELCVATCYFSPLAFARVAGELGSLCSVRLLLGAEPPPDMNARVRPLGEAREGWERGILRDRRLVLDRLLKSELDGLPFDSSMRGDLLVLSDALLSGRLCLRRFEAGFLHAKAYLLRGESGRERVIAGSSNLTYPGLSLNLEANLGTDDRQVADRAGRWFDELWEEATPFDLEGLLQELLSLQLPWLVFLRTLLALYGEEVEADPEGGHGLTEFQVHGVARALRLIEQNGGVLVADEVGLGKTFIAGEIIRRYTERGQRTLLVCPAELRDTTWKQFLGDRQLFCECVSFHQLAGSSQLDGSGSGIADDRCLSRAKDEYQLVVVDEAHNYRNPDTRERARVLRELLRGRRKQLLLLTATPVNNSLWDLHTLLSYFLADGHFAGLGIGSLRERFAEAMRVDPADLSPDRLFKVVDATTVKRTRQFIKRYYRGDSIKDPVDGVSRPLRFPKPHPVTVRYDLEQAAPGLLGAVEAALEPGDGDARPPGRLSFARYRAEAYRLDPEPDEVHRLGGVTALLRSAMLKRFESSSRAFARTLGRVEQDCRLCLEALKHGRVVGTAFLRELDGDDERIFEELMEGGAGLPAREYDAKAWGRDLEADLVLLGRLREQVEQVEAERDPKLAALVRELEKILAQAKREGGDEAMQRNARKVLIFSFFADTVHWIRLFLERACAERASLAAYRDRIVAVTSLSSQEQDAEPREQQRRRAIRGFAPETMGRPGDKDRYDILVSTDLLAEGVNLQQCRHIINYDLPWNPMRLVQRHGRIDRINSRHRKVWLRTIFPDQQLDELLQLQGRIIDKLTLAARSVGVQRPVEDAPAHSRSFSDTRREIRLLREQRTDLFEHGGTRAATQTGEEYRQQLGRALASKEDAARIHGFPLKAGSCLSHREGRGFFFCARIGEQILLRFVRAGAEWDPASGPGSVLREEAACLRIIECRRETPTAPVDWPENAPYLFWQRALEDLLEQWNKLADPASRQPKLRRLNHQVSEFLRKHCPSDVEKNRRDKALEIIESPWPRRDEVGLRSLFQDPELPPPDKARRLVEYAEQSGISPPLPAKPMDPAESDQVQLICWMAVTRPPAAPR